MSSPSCPSYVSVARLHVDTGRSDLGGWIIVVPLSGDRGGTVDQTRFGPDRERSRSDSDEKCERHHMTSYVLLDLTAPELSVYRGSRSLREVTPRAGNQNAPIGVRTRCQTIVALLSSFSE
jgi:hypothetical protein